MWTWFHRLASPPSFFRFADRAAPWLLGSAVLLLAYGWLVGLTYVDEKQGTAFRIIYVHVPAAALSLAVYSAMAVAGAVALIWRLKLAECVLVALPPVGASFTVLALVTGMLWGKPMWGAWWVWDARLTSELIMLFLYFGAMGLAQAFDDPRAAARAMALLSLVGVVNVVVVHYSVDWWNTLHQPATVLKLGRPNITADLARPLYASLLGSALFAAAVVLRRAQNEVLLRERDTAWVRELVRAG